MGENNDTNAINSIIKSFGSQYLKNQYTANSIQPAKKAFKSKKPDYEEKHIIEHVSGDIRRYLQLRYYVHKPSLEYPEISHFLSVIGKYSMYVKLRAEDIAAVISFFQKIYNDTIEFDEKFEHLAPVMEKQAELNAKFEQAVLAGENDPQGE